ncbi:MAG TPA: ATP-binding protein [Sumerlaeia bacterium]|nr:ATP-binding protein [Sumerlaeia bacterium]
MATLTVIEGSDKGQVFSLAGTVIALGRNAENSIVLNDNTVSRFHAQIVQRGDAYYIHDLESTHGTFVNDVRNDKELPLGDNDRIRLGKTELLLRVQEKDKVGATTSAAETASLVQLAEGNERPTGDPFERTRVAFSMPIEDSVAGKGLPEQNLARLSRVADAIQSVFDLNELLRTLMDVLFDVFNVDRGVVLLREGPEGELVEKVTRPPGEKLKISRTIIDHAIGDRMSLLISDTTMDERFSEARSVLAQSILSAICAPLVCKDKVLGVLYIDTQSHWIRYEKEDLALVNIIAANAAIAIENAILVQEKLQSERMAAIGLAMAGISHYVKNVLTGMQGSTGLVDMGITSRNIDLIEKGWPVLQRSTHKLRSLVQDLLTCSKDREPLCEKGNLNALARDVFDGQNSRAQEMGVELVLELDENLPDSDFEQKAIHDCILNIVGNAIEACQETPDARVAIRSKRSSDGEEVVVEIEDNGPGIPKEIAAKIFEPFFSTKGSQGTGLGLAVARKLAEEHGGQLLLDSEVGKGSAFRIILPIHAPEPQDEPTGP